MKVQFSWFNFKRFLSFFFLFCIFHNKFKYQIFKPKIPWKDEVTSGDLYPEGEFPVRFFDTNTLASNNPIEDSHAEAILNFASNSNEPPGMIFGIYDGHGGASCGIVTANRLHHYVAASLLSNEDLQCHLDNLRAAGIHWINLKSVAVITVIIRFFSTFEL